MGFRVKEVEEEVEKGVATGEKSYSFPLFPKAPSIRCNSMLFVCCPFSSCPVGSNDWCRAFIMVAYIA